MRAFLAAAIVAAVVLAGCSSGNKDEDGDGIYSDNERKGWDVTVDFLHERMKYRTGSDPDNFDTDGDGIPDGDEFSVGLDPRASDTDKDGLTDCQEVRHTNRTQCEAADFRGPFDGGHGTDPLRADSDPAVSPYVLDHVPFVDRTGSGYQREYGDGIPDGEEVVGYTVDLPGGRSRFVQTDPRNADTDGDGLDDGEERFLFGTDPEGNTDSDGDGCLDGQDVLPAVEERFTPGVGNFTLKRAMDSDGGADLVITILVGEVRFDLPSTGSFQVNQGQPFEVPEPPAARDPSCSYGPRQPWLLLQLLVSDENGPPEGPRSIDIASETPVAGGRTVNVFWNAQTGAMSWKPDGGDLAPAPLVLEGADGRLELHPRVSLP